MTKMPEGFPSLVGAVIKEDWGWDELPQKDSDIWNALHYPFFLGKNIHSAQAGYVKKVLHKYLTQNEAQRAKTEKWGEKVLKVIDTELDAIQGTPGAGLKKTILENVRGKITSDSRGGLAETLCTALQFFEDKNINVDKIKEIRNDNNKTKELADQARREIYDVVAITFIFILLCTLINFSL